MVVPGNFDDTFKAQLNMGDVVALYLQIFLAGSDGKAHAVTNYSGVGVVKATVFTISIIVL